MPASGHYPGSQFFKPCEWYRSELGALMCAGVLVALFLILRLMRARRREKVALARAFAALEAGASPTAWLAMYKEA